MLLSSRKGRMMNKVSKIGLLIKDTRKTQKLTQEQLAGICGVGVRFIRELEGGKESCHMGKALIVLSMLGIEIKINGQSI